MWLMLTDKQFDDILSSLDVAKARETHIRLAKAQAEIEAINRERTAYYDGAYNAIKMVRAALAAQKEVQDE